MVVMGTQVEELAKQVALIGKKQDDEKDGLKKRDCSTQTAAGRQEVLALISGPLG
jgi:hypothetical protein